MHIKCDRENAEKNISMLKSTVDCILDKSMVFHSIK